MKLMKMSSAVAVVLLLLVGALAGPAMRRAAAEAWARPHVNLK